MKFFAFTSVLFSGLFNFLTSANAASTRSCNEETTSTVGTKDIQAEITECILDLKVENKSIEELEGFLRSMNLQYEITDFDGRVITLKMPYRDKIVLSTQIFAK